jgi:ATP-dependent protease Clp ATPase subunit
MLSNSIRHNSTAAAARSIASSLASALRPKEIVEALDKHIVGQPEAKVFPCVYTIDRHKFILDYHNRKQWQSH